MDKTTNKKKEMENKKEKQAAVGYKRKKREDERSWGEILSRFFTTALS